jgi:2-phospho-L-lactate guanylyltransferase (CobY/MobA/RfbA family)
VERLLALAVGSTSAILVPSLSGTGTNGLFRAPPTAFPSRFGPGSVALHLEEAQRRNVPVQVVPLDSFALDIDDSADVREWLRRGPPSEALAFLRSLEIDARLARLEDAGRA